MAQILGQTEDIIAKYAELQIKGKKYEIKEKTGKN